MNAVQRPINDGDKKNTRLKRLSVSNLWTLFCKICHFAMVGLDLVRAPTEFLDYTVPHRWRCVSPLKCEDLLVIGTRCFNFPTQALTRCFSFFSDEFIYFFIELDIVDINNSEIRIFNLWILFAKSATVEGLNHCCS